MDFNNKLRWDTVPLGNVMVLFRRIACTIGFVLFVLVYGFSQTITLVSNNGSVLYPRGDLRLSFAGSTDYDEFQWFKDGSIISSAIFSTYSVNQPGTYFVDATKRGKKVRSAPFIVTYDPLNGNYILTNEPQIPVTSESMVGNLNFVQSQRKMQYFDGMDRPIQTIQIQGSADATPRDVVNSVEYDAFGRLIVKYLPYVSPAVNGTYQEVVSYNGFSYETSNQFKLYNSTSNDHIARDAKPYAVTVFKPSPLNEISQVGAPGAAWQPGSGAFVGTSEEANGESEVIKFQYHPVGDLTWLGSDSKPMYYKAGQLYRSRVTDEHGFDQITYTDKNNRVLMKRNESADGFLDTYYIYDLSGNLMYVIPPAAIKRLQTATE